MIDIRDLLNGAVISTFRKTRGYCWLLKPGTRWRQSWIQHGRLWWKSTVAETGNKSATKSTVAVTVDLVSGLATNLQRRKFDSLSQLTLLPIRSTLLQMFTGQSNTVDVVDFQQSRPRWIQLCRQCVPGLTGSDACWTVPSPLILANFEGHFRCYKRFHCISKIQHIIMYEVTYLGRTSYVSNNYSCCRFSLEAMLYDAERGLLAIAKFRHSARKDYSLLL